MSCSSQLCLLMVFPLISFWHIAQNFPEGLAVSIPLQRAGFSRHRAFWYRNLQMMPRHESLLQFSKTALHLFF